MLHTISSFSVPVGTLPNLCDPNPCKNGGKCKFLQDKNDYICEDCLGRFTGKDCTGNSRIIHSFVFQLGAITWTQRLAC